MVLGKHIFDFYPIYSSTFGHMGMGIELATEDLSNLNNLIHDILFTFIVNYILT